MCAAPTQDVLNAFGVVELPQLLPGGGGTTYRAGTTILKPLANSVEAEWLANLFDSIKEVGFRVARPIQSIQGTWSVNGWNASHFVLGEEVKGRSSEKVAVSRAFHQVLSPYSQPPHIAPAQHPWAIADRFAWGEEAVKYDRRLAPVLDELLALIQPISLPSQLIHGDMTGNILFHDPLFPAVIDMAPYWRPAEFATAVIVIDSIVWEGADDSLVDSVIGTDQMYQLLLRAAVRRIMELDGIYKQFGQECLDQVDAYQHLITLLRTRARRLDAR